MEAPIRHPLAADLPKKNPKLGSDPEEANLINTAKGRAASGLPWLAAFSADCKGHPFKMLSKKTAHARGAVSYVGGAER